MKKKIYSNVCYNSNNNYFYRSNVNNTSNCSKAIVLLNYYGKCVQKYIQRKMIALNEDMNKVIFILVDVPSCCSCNLIRI